MPNCSVEKWSVAIFAHNEASNIANCLRSVISQSDAHNFPIYVLSNGCTDDTNEVVKSMTVDHPSIQLVVINEPDKANAWNQYAHRIASESDCHFFVDGDVVVERDAFSLLSKVLADSPQSVAAGGLPGSGRTRLSWSRRMKSLGRLAGALYALRGSFLKEIREQEIYIPIGFVGEDFFVTCLAKGQLNIDGLNKKSPRIVFDDGALFSFDSLSPKNPKDWSAYFHRVIRYQIREYQLFMLFLYMQGQTQDQLPTDVKSLYLQSDYKPTYRWRGRMTPIDFIAVWKIRHECKKNSK